MRREVEKLRLNTEWKWEKDREKTGQFTEDKLILLS